MAGYDVQSFKYDRKRSRVKTEKRISEGLEIFESIEKEALKMGDYMACGIVKQFCHN